ncbi:hypothetical protein NQ318_013966 [Aromia moschata]|uniref:Endonuclease/exonuclease/phosphatase domain-containing protein n=1 Tax=Aromia moschata TaxID=1265417 RepID=A0AAV8Z0N5_9CUCU|nr:hypothetical protein NQ318_013966 [Aromia moschata]
MSQFSDIKILVTKLEKQFTESLQSLKTQFEEKIRALTINNTIDENKLSESLVQEITERQRRSKNIIMFNVSESKAVNPTERQNHDIGKIKQFLKEVSEDGSNVTGVVRLGKTSQKPRPLRISFSDENKVLNVLKNKQKVQDKYKEVKIKADETPMQREKDRTLSRGGGVCIYVLNNLEKEKIEVEVLEHLDSSPIESLWLNIKWSELELNIACMYRPPNLASEDDVALLNLLIDASSSLKNLIIFGDFNYPELNWDCPSPTDGNTQSANFMSTYISTNLLQLIKKPTRFRAGNNPSLLDLILVNDPGLISTIEYEAPVGNSDHIVILANTQMNYRVSQTYTQQDKLSIMHLTITKRIEILIMIGYGDKTRSQNTVCEMFNQKYPNKHINQSTVSKIEKKFREHGNVNDLPKRRRPKVANEEMSLNVLLSVQENHHASSRTLGQQHGISHSSIQKILRTHKYHPYKVQLIHELNEDDPDRRVQFCEQMLTICNANPMFLRNLIFCNESTFTLNGIVNRQKYRYWADVNPHWVMEAHTNTWMGNGNTCPQKVNVWAGIVGNRVVGPYFFEGYSSRITLSSVLGGGSSTTNQSGGLCPVYLASLSRWTTFGLLLGDNWMR